MLNGVLIMGANTGMALFYAAYEKNLGLNLHATKAGGGGDAPNKDSQYEAMFLSNFVSALYSNVRNLTSMADGAPHARNNQQQAMFPKLKTRSRYSRNYRPSNSVELEKEARRLIGEFPGARVANTYLLVFVAPVMIERSACQCLS